MFKQWIRNWLNRDDFADMSMSSNTVVGRDELDMQHSIRFAVTAARGGVVVTTRHYDKRSDKSKETIHVIPDGEDIATAIGHIVSMELLSS